MKYRLPHKNTYITPCAEKIECEDDVMQTVSAEHSHNRDGDETLEAKSIYGSEIFDVETTPIGIFQDETSTLWGGE